jgi:N-acyl-D-amino-acid deacylase
MEPTEPTYDYILHRGTIVDGSGRPPFRADLSIQGDRIVAIGDLRHARAVRKIDLSGLIVAPGFIDVHTHDDAVLIESAEMTPKLTQGVTTVIAGNCGISAAPYRASGEPPPGLLRLVFKSREALSATFAEYLQKVKVAAPAINAAFLTGHSTLRMQVMGNDLDRTATRAEIAAMREQLEQCLQEGSLGLSTGLFYPSARAASTHEIIEIAQPLRDYRGIYVTHLRDESDHVMEALEEGLAIGRASGAPVIISHHKCLGRQNFGRSVETLALLERARPHQTVAWDVYPYTAGSTVLNAELVAQSSRTVITRCDPYPQFCGRDLEEVARALGCSTSEAVAKLEPAGALYFMMDEADVDRILSSKEAMIGSDGLPADQHPHPRLWGTFPRVLGRYVRERHLLSLEDAVQRMTGRSALHFGLNDRGVIQAGKHADLCIFDAEKVLDMATYEQPVCPAIGIHYVFVNGRVALEDGVPTSIRAGRVLRRGSS